MKRHNSGAVSDQVPSPVPSNPIKVDHPKWELQSITVQRSLTPEIRAGHARVQGVIDDYLKQQSIKRIIDGIARRKASLGFSSLAVVSLEAKEGRTFFSAVLARGLVRYFNAKVLLIDGTGVGAGQGILSAASTLESAVEKAARQPKGASCSVVCPIGQDSLSQDEFRLGDLIRSVEDEYDFVICDTQPLSANDTKGFDAVSLARQMDMCLALVGGTKATLAHLTKLKGFLRSIDIPCLGCVSSSRD